MVGRGRGRGRGGRAGRGGGAKRGGPRLPATLSKELYQLFGEGSSGDGGRPRNRPPSQDRRRAEREERRDGAGGRQPDQPQRPQQQRKVTGKDGERPAAKRQKLSSRPSAGGGSMFRELLPAHLQVCALRTACRPCPLQRLGVPLMLLILQPIFCLPPCLG